MLSFHSTSWSNVTAKAPENMSDQEKEEKLSVLTTHLVPKTKPIENRVHEQFLIVGEVRQRLNDVWNESAVWLDSIER